MRATRRLLFASPAPLLGFGPLHAYAAESDANLSGPYGFRLVGLDNVVTHSWVVATGEFTANGKGNITAGSTTYNDDGAVCTASLANRAYTIVSDGEGTLQFALTGLSGSCPIGPTFNFAARARRPQRQRRSRRSRK